MLVGEIIPTAAQFGYHRYEFEGYLGNVGLTLSPRKSPNRSFI